MRHFLVFILSFLLLSVSYHLSSSIINAATLTACPEGCPYAGGDGLQQAIDAAKDGDTIIMQSGNYRRNGFTPITGEKYNQCFISTKGKSITIRGEGKALIEGQNDELGTGTKGLFRIGICEQKGKVEISIRRILIIYLLPSGWERAQSSPTALSTALCLLMTTHT
jgi:hypothetical protein